MFGLRCFVVEKNTCFRVVFGENVVICDRMQYLSVIILPINIKFYPIYLNFTKTTRSMPPVLDI